MKKTGLMAGCALWVIAGAANAQDAYFVQIEAHPALTVAEDRARTFAAGLPDVNGFSIGGGWYGIALGPYTEEEANQRRLELRRQGQIPSDSFVEEADQYAQRFWPIGAGAIQSPEPQEPQDNGAQAQNEPDPEPELRQAEETPAEARRAEQLLTRGEREDLQVALQWAGFYNGRIDAAFGRGTRGAMAGWQEANNYEATGVLTTAQRAELFRQYNAVLDGMGLRRVTDRRAGIEMELPTGVVAFDRAESPFVRYEPTGEVPEARVLLISEPGDRRTLYGLYEIMQTLEIVPTDGPRERQGDSFRLVGENSRIVSHTEAFLSDGAIKGFTLIWPAGDEERRTRILARMQETFSRLDGVVLDPATLSDEGQAIDLVAGLQVRQPKVTASGFFADSSGRVLTSDASVAECGRITLDELTEAEIVARAGGLALLEPQSPLAPRNVPVFRTDAPRLQSEIAVAGFSYGGILGAPTVTFGTLADVRGLNGEEGVKRLSVSARPGDAGGPVFDGGGAVVGMLTPVSSTGQQLPENVSFATASERLVDFFREAGVSVETGRGEMSMAPEDLTQVARGITVLVECWE
ncbi:trypsin-like peptidase domain-containing protein [Roseivivax sp. THAF30]|uniref:trypsin-like peptidase domain-containing protein n=1 Tax=Roseivivax sp. THAF30 TaxID=2587852 RepID=UPI001268E04B|nr:trypsin-like peptidase domain-containing protein [Roseivivax sp. THAF30]QFT62939.1 Putative peptidoglycan binding domain protein [Roseivivax sp. THAF30]